MDRVRHRMVTSACALLFGLPMVVVVAAGAQASPRAASPGDVVISELNYHAGSDLDTDDFLELTNVTGATIDVSGWTFTAGVNATLPGGLTIESGKRIVLSPDSTRFTALYGFAPDANYTGKLSNSGEAVTLADETGTAIATVTYSDTAPWPGAPDGTGPSLELRGLDLDPALPENWGASLVNGGTPKAVNSIEGAGVPPVVKDLTVTPLRPDPGQAVVVTARLPKASTATLTYKVMFNADAVTTFRDDANSPGGANDGVYAGTIPGQAAGQLVRYRIDAVSAGKSFGLPVAGDTIHYKGVVVRNPAVVTSLPVLEWFMADSVYNDLLANHRYDDVSGPAVIAYNGIVFDGAQMHVRGRWTRSLPKVSWKIDLAPGYPIDFRPLMPYLLDEFALQREADPLAATGWPIIRAAGSRALTMVTVRSQRNGQFHSLGQLMETEDGVWRKAENVDNWAIYKSKGGSLAKTASVAALVATGWLEKKARETEDYSDVWNLSQVIDAPASAAQKEWIYLNINVPEMINYMALLSLIRHWDSGWYNWTVARDTDGTGRWEMWIWDIDSIFGTAATWKGGEFVPPVTSNKLTTAMLAYPEFKEMFLRRLRTLADRFLAGNTLQTQFDAAIARSLSDWNLDVAKWAGWNPTQMHNLFVNGLAERRAAINKYAPASQSAAPNVVINEIQYRPLGGDNAEFVELANPSATESVDLSGWTIPEIGLTIQAGTIIRPKSFVVFVAHDKTFRTTYSASNRYVGGEYSGQLSDAGQTLTLRQGARIVDTVTYGIADPWPVAANGTGPSLELKSVTADNALATSWTATSTAGGTPAATNTGSGGPTTQTLVPFKAVWRFNDKRVDLGTAWRATGYADGAWKSGAGQLGFGDGDEATIVDRGTTTSRIITAYFRKAFTVTAKSTITSAKLSLVRDDGAVVYLNGVEIARTNMPTGTITYGKLALTSVANENTPITITVPVSRLATGTNVLAVEVHQNAASSSDMSFDAQLTVTRSS